MTLLVDAPAPAPEPTQEPPSRTGVLIREPDPFEKACLRKVNVRSVVVIAAVFNAVIGVALFSAGWFVISVASSRGVFDGVNPPDGVKATNGGGLSAEHLTWLWGAIVLGWSLLMTAVAALATVVLNWSAQLFGGIEVEVAPKR